jgi:hypothetical protein
LTAYIPLPFFFASFLEMRSTAYIPGSLSLQPPAVIISVPLAGLRPYRVVTPLLRPHPFLCCGGRRRPLFTSLLVTPDLTRESSCFLFRTSNVDHASTVEINY